MKEGDVNKKVPWAKSTAAVYGESIAGTVYCVFQRSGKGGAHPKQSDIAVCPLHGERYCTILYYTVLYCTMLHCAALCCPAPRLEAGDVGQGRANIGSLTTPSLFPLAISAAGIILAFLQLVPQHWLSQSNITGPLR